MSSRTTTDAGKNQRPNRHVPFDRHRLIRRRAEAGLTQEALASKAGCAHQHISRLELGRNKPSIHLASRLAAALGCEVADLMPDEVPF